MLEILQCTIKLEQNPPPTDANTHKKAGVVPSLAKID